jgi:hypothetical protein
LRRRPERQRPLGQSRLRTQDGVDLTSIQVDVQWESLLALRRAAYLIGATPRDLASQLLDEALEGIEERCAR